MKRLIIASLLLAGIGLSAAPSEAKWPHIGPGGRPQICKNPSCCPQDPDAWDRDLEEQRQSHEAQDRAQAVKSAAEAVRIAERQLHVLRGILYLNIISLIVLAVLALIVMGQRKNK